MYNKKNDLNDFPFFSFLFLHQSFTGDLTHSEKTVSHG